MGEKKNQINNHSKKLDCFLEDSFWNDIESFWPQQKDQYLSPSQGLGNKSHKICARKGL